MSRCRRVSIWFVRNPSCLARSWEFHHANCSEVTISQWLRVSSSLIMILKCFHQLTTSHSGLGGEGLLRSNSIPPFDVCPKGFIPAIVRYVPMKALVSQRWLLMSVFAWTCFTHHSNIHTTPSFWTHMWTTENSGVPSHTVAEFVVWSQSPASSIVLQIPVGNTGNSELPFITYRVFDVLFVMYLIMTGWGSFMTERALPEGIFENFQ